MNITTKIVQAGLVDRTTMALLKKWGQLSTPWEAESASADTRVHSVTSQTLQEFVEDIEKIIEVENKNIRETRLEILVKDIHDLWSPTAGYFTAVEDEAGYLFVRCKYSFKPGDLFFKDHHSSLSKESALFEVHKVEYVYENDKKHLKQLIVEKLGEQ